MGRFLYLCRRLPPRRLVRDNRRSWQCAGKDVILQEAVHASSGVRRRLAGSSGALSFPTGKQRQGDAQNFGQQLHKVIVLLEYVS